MLTGAVTATLLGQAPAGAEDGYGNDPCTTGEPCSSVDLPIVHPLMDSALQDGRVPVLDVKDAPSGRRYAVAEGELATEGNQLIEQSGVIKLNQRRPGQTELQQLYTEKLQANDGLQPDRDNAGSRKVGMTLRNAIRQSRPGASHLVQLRVREPDAATTVDDLERAIGRGEVRTRLEAHQRRQQLLAERRVRVAEAQQPVVEAITRFGGQLVARYDNLFGLSARLTARQIKQLRGLTAV
ncbi:MAG: hypothetical protein KJO55_05390, partial [Gammaproteobacteria bacterium]|nr:hypothetical protein [Gammaproteobacteria bacterium]